MVSETICLDIIQALYGQSRTLYQFFVMAGFDSPIKGDHNNALGEKELYSLLLPRYGLQAIDSAIRWLDAVGYLEHPLEGEFRPRAYKLSDKGCEVAKRGAFTEEERHLFYQTDPYAVFVAHQFNPDDQDLVDFIRGRLLEPAGFRPVDGRADGLEEFRHSILKKIADCRFFLCLLTRRQALESGGYASSVWLYQEVGAAMALGKQPLLLVEDGINPDFVGELQRIYEHIPFTRSNHPKAFQEIVRRFRIDLETNLIPLPQGLETS